MRLEYPHDKRDTALSMLTKNKFTRPKLGVTGHNSILVTIQYTADPYTRNSINFNSIPREYSLTSISCLTNTSFHNMVISGLTNAR